MRRRCLLVDTVNGWLMEKGEEEEEVVDGIMKM